MKHYDITIIGSGDKGKTLARQLEERYHILLVDGKTIQCRNTIKNEDGYTVIVHQGKKTIQILTGILIQADTF